MPTKELITRQRKALVVGAGPVGALTALALNKRGWDVELWEARDDPRGRTVSMTNLRSINLNISARGLAALESVDPALSDLLLSESIPMPSRMIHHLDGRMEAQAYDPLRHQHSNSISRSILNQRLVEALPKSVDVRFNTKIERLDLDKNVAFGRTTGRGAGLGEETEVTELNHTPVPTETDFDLVVGADGSWSKVRAQMMRNNGRVDFSQKFISHAYIELHMPPNADGGFAMPPNHLHIWPRHAFMLIALPNKDFSFTLTLFIPFEELDKLESRDQVEDFFATHFANAYDIVGSRMVDDFIANPRGNLVTISVAPSTSPSVVLLGDACHSMVPFYGQGLNCGLEDVRVLDTYLENYGVKGTTTTPVGEQDDDLAAALAAYSSERAADLEAICELALSNYTEMRSSVLSPLYHVRRVVDWVLTRIYPSTGAASLLASPNKPFPTSRVRGWTALYDLVTFRPDVGYAEARRREAWQKSVVHSAAITGAAGVAGAVGIFALRMAQPWLSRR